MTYDFSRLMQQPDKNKKKKKVESINQTRIRKKLEYLTDKESKQNKERIEAGKAKLTEIQKDIKQGKNVFDVLEDCIECISSMTGNNAFYLQAKADIEKSYLIELSELEAIEREHKRLLDKLDRLKKAHHKELDIHSRARIDNQINKTKNEIIGIEEKKEELEQADGFSQKGG